MKQKTPVKSNGTRVHDVCCSVRKTEERLNNRTLFQLGRVVITPAALQVLIPGDVVTALGRLVRGDWGDVGSEDKDENELSLREALHVVRPQDVPGV